eukprot:10209458-Alexandrium_andersonii.AAC.1
MCEQEFRAHCADCACADARFAELPRRSTAPFRALHVRPCAQPDEAVQGMARVHNLHNSRKRRASSDDGSAAMDV